MKTNIFKLSCLALVTVWATACSQDEVINAPAEEQQNPVASVITTMQGFLPDAETRVTDTADGDNYKTTFEDGDKIGVSVTLADGTVVCKNMCMTYDGTNWNGESTLYYYKNAKYVAYSPYNQNVTDATKVEELTTYFSENVLPTGTYEESDLMTATFKTKEDIPDDTALKFEFEHAMSMVEFVIPVTKYVTTGGYHYCSPIFRIDLKKKTTTAAEETTIKPLALGNGVFRSLLAPVAESVTDQNLTFTGDLLVGNDAQPVYFTTQTPFQPLAGHYKKVTVSYTGAPDATETPRDIEVGDYFYSDGGIVAHDAEKIPAQNCVGIVYQVATADAPIKVGGVNRQAYVISAHEVGNSADWGNADNAIIPRFMENEALADETNNFAAMVKNTDGYSVKTQLETAGVLNQFAACYAAANYDAALPSGTTGWYLPTLAQLAIAFNNLAGKTWDTTNYSNVIVNTTVEEYNAVLEKFTKVGGNIGNGGDTYYLWSCTDRESITAENQYGGGAWGLCFNSRTSGTNNRKILAGALRKVRQNSRTMMIRPVLAF